MKQRSYIYIRLLLMLGLSACGGGGGGDSSGTGSASGGTPPIAVTPAGVASGTPTSATIGAPGGSLASSDGRLTITVPAGALASDTVIGIQPITATAPGALGDSFRLTPDGVTFARPVTLTFAYSADEAGASVPASLRVATQDASGRWSVINPTHDPAQRTLTVTTTHFSDWSYVAGLQVLPASASVAVYKTQVLRVIDCGEGPDPDGGNTQRLLLECVEPGELPQLARNWSVNGVPGGSSGDGTVVGGSSATYTAPAAVPAQNPVAVSAQIGTSDGVATLVSNITVFDDLVVYTGTISGRSETEALGEVAFEELNANLSFTYNPNLSTGGVKWYDGRGTAVVRAKPFGCSSEGSGSAPVTNASLVLHTAGPLAGTYTISAGAIATITATCGNPPRVVTFQQAAAAGAGGDGVQCPSVPIGTDPSRLAGSWSCAQGGGTTLTSTWAFEPDVQ